MASGYTNNLAIKCNLEKMKPFKREKKIRGKSDALFACSYFISCFISFELKFGLKL